MSDTYKPEPKPEEGYGEYAEHGEMPGYNELMELFEKYFGNPEAYPDGLNAEVLEEELGDGYEYDYETAHTALEDYFNQYGVPEEHRQPVYDAMESHEGGYGAEALAEGLNVNYTEVNNYVDQSVHAGDNAWIETDNEANVATASAEGAIAVGDDLQGHAQSQTGNENIGGDDVDSDVESTNVWADDIVQSEFGAGDNNPANELTQTQDIDVKESFNEDVAYDTSDDDTVKVDVDYDEGGYGHEVPEYHEPEYEYHEEPDYKPEPDYKLQDDHHEPEPHYDDEIELD